MWCGQERQFRSALRNCLHGKSPARRLAPPAKLRKDLREAVHRLGAFAQIKRRFGDSGVPKQELRQLESCVAGCSNDGAPHGSVHRSMASNRCCTAVLAAREGVITRTVSSPPMVPATSRSRSPSTAAAKGCAPPGGVLRTRRLSAGRTSSRYSRTARASVGSACAPCSPALVGRYHARGWLA